MAPRKIYPGTFLETEVKLTILQSPWILLTLSENELNISLFPVTGDLPRPSPPFRDDREQSHNDINQLLPHPQLHPTWSHAPM